MYDVCVVGGGIASLYAAHRIMRARPGTRLCILEACPRLGGRLGTVQWKGATLVIGAGIVRMDKDRRLVALMRELGVRPNPFRITVRYSRALTKSKPLRAWVAEYRRSLASPAFRRHRETFRSWGTKVWGLRKYKAFATKAGYTDYERADACDTIRDYGFDDNASGNRGGSVPWSALIAALAKRLVGARICTNARATRLRRADDGWTVEYRHRGSVKHVRARRVVVGTTIAAARALVPAAILRGIQSQPFILVYAQVTGIEVPGYTVVPNALQKVIPMSNGVYLIAYADNANALLVHGHARANDRAWFERQLADGLGLERDTVRIKAMTHFFWKEGTHYFTPLPPQFKDRDEFLFGAQRPLPGVVVVGEGLSRDQGWTEGALASVEAVLPDIV